jgi:hypothetical protein
MYHRYALAKPNQSLLWEFSPSSHPSNSHSVGAYGLAIYRPLIPYPIPHGCPSLYHATILIRITLALAEILQFNATKLWRTLVVLSPVFEAFEAVNFY